MKAIIVFGVQVRKKNDRTSWKASSEPHTDLFTELYARIFSFKEKTEKS